jgi:diaminopimelate decarboxylase
MAPRTARNADLIDTSLDLPTRPGPSAAGSPWPRGAAWAAGELVIAGVGAGELASRFGTPAYVLDEDDFRSRCREWRDALPDGDVHYASKAFLCTEVVRWVTELGLSLDVCTGGELAVALAGRMPPSRIVFHGNNKSPAELRRAVAVRVGCVVIDSFVEIERLGATAAQAGVQQPVMIRVTPGVDAPTHEAIATGGEDQKFGFSLAGGAAAQAVGQVLATPSLELTGLHCHIGSQIVDTSGFPVALRRLVRFLAAVDRDHGVRLPQLDMGGGLGIAHRPGDQVPPTPAEHVAALRTALVEECAAAEVTWSPRLAVEPGRSIAGPTTVTLYEVGTVKETAGCVYVSVDGGMSDNPRPALYDAGYTVVLAARASDAPLRAVTVCGKHCESGDVLVRDAWLPADVRPGDLLAVPASGAYHRAMGHNYNHVLRPPVVAVRAGAARAVVRRETEDDLLRLYI